jgi:putative transposase
VSSYRLIEAERTSFSIPLMCRMLGVSRSGYYDWRGRPPSKRSRQDAALSAKIRQIHRSSRETYGSPRVHAELRALGTCCSRKRVERLMREAGLRGCIRGKRIATTHRSKRASPAEDLLKRDFRATKMDKIWVADITYVLTEEGFLYLAFILDVYSRRIVGWAMEDHLRTEIVVDALQMAIWRRKPAPGLFAPFRPGSAVHGAIFRREVERSGHRPVDGKDRERPG